MSLHIITNPRLDIDADIMKLLCHEAEEKGQVVIHFLYRTPRNALMNIRIWSTTYLFDQHSDHASDLIHVENIELYPNWRTCLPGEHCHFTLIFSGLPKSCKVFDFIEQCDNQYGAFEARNILRNESDVYYLEMV